MLLILEILLTISAWRKGYKGWALLPVGLALFIGFRLGLNDPEAAASGDLLDYIWIDILAVVILAVMNAAASKPEDLPEKQLTETGEAGECYSHTELAASHSEPGMN